MNTTSHTFWEDKEPCWEMMGCSHYVREKCAAYLHPETPCWKQERTQCEVVLGIPRSCPNCKVFRLCHIASPS